MKTSNNYYLMTPVGEQLLAHYKGRKHLRRRIPLFPFAFRQAVRELDMSVTPVMPQSSET